MPISARPYRIALLAVLAAATTACATGDRPTVTSDPIVEDEGAAGVANLLAQPAQRFTATYRITPTTSGVEPVDATVVKDGDDVRITIGRVDYLLGDGTITCVDELSECFDGVRDGYVSDLNITHQFWNAATSQRLRTDVRRNIGTTEEYEAQIAGAGVTCADVKLDGGAVTYCAHDSGVVARYSGADTNIELVSFSDSASPDALSVVEDPPASP